MKALTALLLALAAVLGGVLAYRSYAPAELHGTALDRPHLLSSALLLRDDGQTVSLPDSGGKMRLVFFGYTRCPDVCPITLGMLAHAWDSLNEAQRAKLAVQVITVDPSFDRPAVLRRYLDSFSPAFQGLTSRSATGDMPEIAEAQRSMYVYSSKGAAAGTLIHGDGVALVDRSGQFLRVYNNQAVVNGELTTDLPQLLHGP